MNRRKYLAVAGGAIPVAGCIGDVDDEEGDGPAEASESELESEDAEEEPESEDENTEEEPATEEEPGSDTDEEDPESEEEEPEETSVAVTVDWDYLEGLLIEQAQTTQPGVLGTLSASTEGNITHVGVRVEYPDADAAFSQSTTKALADNEGIVTLNVPPAEEANIYLVAVEYEESDGTGLLLASENGTQIEEDTANEWVTDDFEWVAAEWFVTEEYEDEYGQGKFHVDKDKQLFRLPYLVTYPFQPGQELTYEQLLVGITGQGITGENLDDYYKYYAAARNPSEGESSETSHSFYPHVVSERFSLPPARYQIGPTGEFTVMWE